ncbi:hypothetical protein [Paludisphaera rhizosphaerae]|uniref:hypothetical protein n=1 Tax=Paludisphaera rhizosphaerae TaxID=2711216 RepID=UPI0013EA4124|nr:hypothetical protein [Paludisphaera rhizosphaerae]
MTDWPHTKIRATALWFIGKHTMDPSTWRYTLLGDAHPEVLGRVALEPGERPLVSFFFSEASWYLFTTRRVLGEYAGERVEAAARDVLGSEHRDPKGRSGAELTVMTLHVDLGEDVAVRKAPLQIETGGACMAPIYYLRYWRFKYPILDRLKDDPAAGTARKQ